MTRRSVRKSKARRRKQKFLSLRLQLSPDKTIMKNSCAPGSTRRHPQLNLNLYPHNQTEDEDVAADFFAAAVDDGGTATLTAILGEGSPSDENNNTVSPSLTFVDGAQDSVSPSLTHVQDNSEESALLVRTAMRRSNGKDERDEKWVCYEEVTSCDADLRVNLHPRGLSLKLDYQEIIDAWSDKGPLHVAGPQTVPELCDDSLCWLNDGWRSNEAMWTVPENTVGNKRVKEEHELEEELKIRHREASVLRYKEKRQNRLFSKRIRYEVRKINAEKRPRMKGRFVKRS